MTERFKNDQSFHKYTTEVKNMTEKKQPLKKIRFGAICATIWRDTYSDSKGNSFDKENVVLDRSYKDKKGEWKHTGSLRKEDLLSGALALQRAFEFLAATDGTAGDSEPAQVEVESVR